MKEEFADIKGYEGIYQISNFGNVKSLKRPIWLIKNQCFGIRKERILKPSLVSKGYLQINLSKDGVRKHFKIHQLIAIAFLNHTQNKHNEIIDHIDNNPSNNLIDNLQITTCRHNVSKDRKGFTSKFVGVCWDKRHLKWRSNIRINNKQIHLGLFTSEIEASQAYQLSLKTLLL